MLSNILIKVGEEIDLGSKGIYKIKSGDTLSTIAQDNGMLTKDLLKLNAWLLDENRVKFLQNKILVDTTLSESDLNNTNHTLIGDSNAENLLIDANGGDNKFIGGSKKDIMQSKGKKIAIVVDTTGSMQDDIDRAKQTARVIANNIFRTNTTNTQYSKISIVTFSDNNIKTIGTYTTINSFETVINSIFIENGSYEYAMAAMLEGMSNFGVDNGLSKEIYLMTDESGDDNERKAEVLAMAKDLKMSMARMVKNKNYDNSVKINVISIDSNLNHFKELSDATGGMYFANKRP